MASYHCTVAVHWGCHANIHWISHLLWETDVREGEWPTEVWVQLYPCGWRCCVHTFLPCINIGVISHISGPVTAGRWEVVPHSQFAAGVFRCDWKETGKTLHSYASVWISSLVPSCLRGTFPIQQTANADQGDQPADPPDYQWYVTVLFYYCLPFVQM